MSTRTPLPPNTPSNQIGNSSSRRFKMKPEPSQSRVPQPPKAPISTNIIARNIRRLSLKSETTRKSTAPESRSIINSLTKIKRNINFPPVEDREIRNSTKLYSNNMDINNSASNISLIPRDNNSQSSLKSNISTKAVFRGHNYSNSSSALPALASGTINRSGSIQSELSKSQHSLATSSTNISPANSVKRPHVKLPSKSTASNSNLKIQLHPELIQLAFASRSIPDLSIFSFSAKNAYVGLNNLGNTCYMNSILQCLMSIRHIIGIVKGPFNVNSRLQREHTVAKAFFQLIESVLNSRANSCVSPSNFKNVIQRRVELFQGYDQHDAQECLRAILNELHLDLNDVKQIPKFTYKDSELDVLGDSIKSQIQWNRYKKYENSVLLDIFGGQLQSTIVCKSCKTPSVTFDTVWDLSIPVTGRREGLLSMLNHCLDEYFKEEDLESDYNCSTCKKYEKATKGLKLSKLPQILVLHLKRFRYNPNKKLDHSITYPLNLNMQEYQSDFLKTLNTNYTLIAISNHSGSVHGGHYTATTKNWNDDGWCERNDSQVTSLGSGQPNNNTSAYILFYERQV
ncbi:hypothetical protein BC833DRAFT_619235 [Globomyces pollinis-pini]|nr:hypothetical protein BC833DRAFT_619235 [Globomyces pollinis-pini]